MTDLHTHILPGIDDGAADADISEKQLSALASQGVSAVAATSHYYGQTRSPRQFLELRAQAFDRIRCIIPAGMEIYLGAEVHFTGQLPVTNEKLCALSIGKTRYILVEFPFKSDWDRSLWSRLKDFISETDYVPVIAHVERYEEVRKNPAILSELKYLGCLLQVNTSAFSEASEKGLAFALLKHGLIDCLGTDTHNMEKRAPDYTVAAAAIKAAGAADRFERIQDNMRRILRDDFVSVEEAKPVKKIFGKYF